MTGSREEDFKEKMHFHYVTYMATPQHKNPCSRGHDILVDLSLVIIYSLYAKFVWSMPGSREEEF